MRKTLIVLAAALILSLLSASFAGAEMSVKDVNLSDYFTSRDLAGEWEENEAHEITLTESLTIDEAGTYLLSGEIPEGTLTIDVSKDDKVQLVLKGVSIHCSTFACIYVKSADKVFITLAEGTENTLVSDGFSDGETDAAVFSKDDIVFNGEGKLTITSAGHGIAGNDDVKFCGGEYVIQAKARGITAKDSIRISDGSFTISSCDTPIRARNKKNAEKGYVLILGGSFYLHTQGENGD